MKLKKVTAVFLASAMALGILAGCGSTGENSSVEQTQDEASAEDSSANGEAVNKTGFPIMNEDYTFKIVHPVASTDKIGS